MAMENVLLQFDAAQEQRQAWALSWASLSGWVFFHHSRTLPNSDLLLTYVRVSVPASNRQRNAADALGGGGGSGSVCSTAAPGPSGTIECLVSHADLTVTMIVREAGKRCVARGSVSFEPLAFKAIEQHSRVPLEISLAPVSRLL